MSVTDRMFRVVADHDLGREVIGPLYSIVDAVEVAAAFERAGISADVEQAIWMPSGMEEQAAQSSHTARLDNEF